MKYHFSQYKNAGMSHAYSAFPAKKPFLQKSLSCKKRLRPLQNLHLRRISALCAARSFACLYDMSALAVLLRLEPHPYPGLVQRSQTAKIILAQTVDSIGLNWIELDSKARQKRQKAF